MKIRSLLFLETADIGIPTLPEKRLTWLQQQPERIKFITNPTFEEMELVVRSDGTKIQYIKNPPPGIIKIAILQDYQAIRNVTVPIPFDAQIAAVSKSIFALNFIAERTDPIAPEAIKIALQHHKWFEIHTDYMGLIYNESTYKSMVQQVFKNNNLLIDKWMRYYTHQHNKT
jgi:hypothetical protein